MAQLLDSGVFSVLDTDSSLGVGWKLNFYVSGTSTRLDTYPTLADAAAGTNANTNPVVLGADARVPPIWYLASAKLIVTDENDVVKETLDPVQSFGAAGLDFLQSGTGAVSRTAQDKMREVGIAVLDYVPSALRAAIADGSSTDDHSAYYQAAINAAQALGGNDTGYPDVLVPYGRTNIASNVTLKSAKLRGQGSWLTGSKIIWTGALLGTMFTKSDAFPGGASWGGLQNLWLGAGSNKPDSYLQLDAAVDKGFILDRVAFHYCTSHAVKCNEGWVNLHWEHLRFDGVDGYGIYLKPYAAQSYSSAIIDKFTYDSSGATTTVKGVIGVDVTLTNGNPGQVALTNGRIEINTNALSQGVLNWLTTDSAKAGQIDFVLENVTYADAATSTDSLLWMERGGGFSGNASLLARNVWTNNLSATIGLGAATVFWAGGAVAVPTDGRYRYLDIGFGNDALRVLGTDGFEAISATATDHAFRSRILGEAEPQYDRLVSGKTQWGAGGASAVDTNLYRSAANVLKTDDKFLAALGIGVGNSAAAGTPGTVVKKMEVFDASGASLGFVPIYDAIT